MFQCIEDLKPIVHHFGLWVGVWEKTEASWRGFEVVDHFARTHLGSKVTIYAPNYWWNRTDRDLYTRSNCDSRNKLCFQTTCVLRRTGIDKSSSPAATMCQIRINIVSRRGTPWSETHMPNGWPTLRALTSHRERHSWFHPAARLKQYLIDSVYSSC